MSLINKFSELKDRILWYDGSSSFSANKLADFILNGDDITEFFVSSEDKSVKNYNSYNHDNPLLVKYDISELDTSWKFPKQYSDLDLDTFFLSFISKLNLNDKESNRIHKELQLVRDLNMENLFRSIIFILDVFKNNNIVWGVGRGSSCASYLLYLIDLHMVNPVKYDIPENEFFKNVINTKTIKDNNYNE